MKERPWIWIVIAFTAFVVALGGVVVIAQKNAPQPVPLKHGH